MKRYLLSSSLLTWKDIRCRFFDLIYSTTSSKIQQLRAVTNSAAIFIIYRSFFFAFFPKLISGGEFHKIVNYRYFSRRLQLNHLLFFLSLIQTQNFQNFYLESDTLKLQIMFFSRISYWFLCSFLWLWPWPWIHIDVSFIEVNTWYNSTPTNL